MDSLDEWWPEGMENPHWCECGWRDVPNGLAWERCEICGYTGIPEDAVESAEDLLQAFSEHHGDDNWGPFYWHSVQRATVAQMGYPELARAIECGDESWMGLIAPKLKSQLHSYSADQKVFLLQNGSPRWRTWVIANLR